MKITNTPFGLALCAALMLIWSSATHGSTISYTYDAAGRLVTAGYGANRTTSYAYDNAGNLLQSSTPTPGMVIGSIVNRQFTLSWPSTPGGFVLQSASAIGPGAQWTNVGITPSQSGNLYSVTLTVGGTTFYRLKNANP